MSARWTFAEEETKRAELAQLYIVDNKTIGEIGRLLGISETTVYDRIIRLGLPSLRLKKARANNRRSDIKIPQEYSEALAEFIGILLGDGSISPTQVAVTLGRKDEYSPYVKNLIKRIFKIEAREIITKGGHRTVYFGSTEVVRWLKGMGLVYNKVESQVDIPRWIFKNKRFMRSALRGLYDTDGSVYKLKFGAQISFCNHSRPLMISVRRMLGTLGFSPSKISGHNLYLTKKENLVKFFKEIGFGNNKHHKRFLKFYKRNNGCVA